MMIRTIRKPLAILSILILFFAAGLYIWLRRDTTSGKAKAPFVPIVAADSVVKANPIQKFGISLDSFAVYEETVQRNESLSDILGDYEVDMASIASLAEQSKPMFDVRSIKAGNPYTVFCTKDSFQKAQYFVYQPNPVDYIVFDLRNPLRVYRGKRTVAISQKSISGEIRGSLYETLEKSQADPSLAIKLANVFAWTIDFYAIQAGDWYKIVYEERSIRDNPVESGNILSAIFSHKGEVYSAFYFQPDSARPGDYFDAEGKSLRRAFLKAPLKFSRISSRYTLHRFHPVQKRWKAHLGTDYAAPTGTPIISTANGLVIESRFSQFNGNYVKIRHNNMYTTQYLHMSRRAVKPGQVVRQGQVIGYVGSTGLATGPHVCYRFWKNGRQVDPLHQKFPSAEPVARAEKVEFDKLVMMQQALLEKMALDSMAGTK